MSADFELLRFEAAPAGAAVALLELDGRFAGPAPARVRLLVERGGRGVEVPAVTSGGESPWSATFAIALDDLADDRTEYALAPGRGPLIALPAPEAGGGPEEDRYVRLARQANDLRHRLEDATDAAAEVEAVRAELADAERRAEDDRERLRAQLAEATRRAEEAERATAAARTEREAAIEDGEAAREERSSLREQLRETESRLTETERERAALRARAESADRTIADLNGRAETLEQRARDAEAKVVAAEDETRLARRDLRDTRARLESLLREQRHHDPARRGHEVPDRESGEDGTAETTAVEPGPSPSPSPERTEVLETREITPHENGTSGDDAPRTTATATRATRVVRARDELGDEPRAGEDRPSRHAPEPLDPARVGAGHIEPSQTRPSVLTPARIMVGIALLLLVAALVAILLGAGLVD